MNVMEHSTRDFDRLVERALEGLPPEIERLLDNVAIVIEDWPENGEHLYGFYEGVPLTERDTHYYGTLPDRITIYQGPLEQDFMTDSKLEEQVRVTVVHEIAHHFGFDEDEIDNLGWA
jgi:predicted Zn-dependent protease with MMP-like domain